MNMTPADEVLLQVLEWLEPENVTRLLEISKECGIDWDNCV
jgi:hypothetical protein